MPEVQKHGKFWEKEILKTRGVTEDELKAIKYTSKMDLPAHLDRLDKSNISVKTTNSPNMVCMGDCLRVFDSSIMNEPIHMISIQYTQEADIKKVVSIIEIDLTNSREELFGTLTREQIEELDKVVKSIPKRRRPTEEERNRIYSLQESLQAQSGAIYLNIKIDSKSQRRLQCSFNQFKIFIEKNPDRVVSKSNTHEFRGGAITAEIPSGRRVFNSIKNENHSTENSDKINYTIEEFNPPAIDSSTKLPVNIFHTDSL